MPDGFKHVVCLRGYNVETWLVQSTEREASMIWFAELAPLYIHVGKGETTECHMLPNSSSFLFVMSLAPGLLAKNYFFFVGIAICWLSRLFCLMVILRSHSIFFPLLGSHGARIYFTITIIYQWLSPHWLQKLGLSQLEYFLWQSRRCILSHPTFIHLVRYFLFCGGKSSVQDIYGVLIDNAGHEK